MADKRHRFSKKELTAHEKSGALEFIASMVGIKVEVLLEHHTKKGVLAGVGDTKDGRRDLVKRLAKMSDKKFAAAVKKGHVEVLALAWGITPERVIKLRADNYPDQR